MNWMCPYCASYETFWIKDRYHCQDCGKTWEHEDEEFDIHAHEIINGGKNDLWVQSNEKCNYRDI